MRKGIRKEKKMTKLMKVLLVATVIANLSALVYFIDDSRTLRKQIADINNIRVQLPEEFKNAVADQTSASTKAMVRDVLEQASRGVAEELARVGRSNDQAVARLVDVASSNLQSVVWRLEDGVTRVNKLCQEHEVKRAGKVADAESAFALYESDPSNEVAILYLQIAIRKNPSELKYIRSMWRAVEQSGMDAGLVQEFQAMLSYCLDEAPADRLAELATLVKDLRAGIAKLEVGSDASENQEDNESRIAKLKDSLSSNELVLEFDSQAEEIASRRGGILRELAALDDSADYAAESESAELIVRLANAADRINGYVQQAGTEIARVGQRSVASEDELRDVLTCLGATAVLQPIVLAQQDVQSLYGMLLSARHTNVVEACRKELEKLDRLVRESSGKADKMKAKMIRACVDSMASEPSGSCTTKYTEQLKNIDKQGKIISNYIGCISNPEIANGVLARQLELLEETRKVQRARMKKYQEESAAEMREIAKEIKKYKDDAWRKEYKKNQAVPLLKRLVKIDPDLLVPEIQELYQYEYSQLTTDFNAWIEKENAYEYKAEFMVELAGVEKNKLEDL